MYKRQVYKPDGTPFEGDPRYVLKRALAEAKEMGYTMNVGPECEFFLFQTDENGMPTTNTYERASYFDLGPLDFGENARRDMVLTLEQMGFEIEASHHEVAPAPVSYTHLDVYKRQYVHLHTAHVHVEEQQSR